MQPATYAFLCPPPFVCIDALHLFALFIFLITSCHSWLCLEEKKREGRVWREKESKAWHQRERWEALAAIWERDECVRQKPRKDALMALWASAKCRFRLAVDFSRSYWMLEFFPNPGFVKTDHALVNLLHLYSEIGTSAHCKHLFFGIGYHARGYSCPLLELSRHKLEQSDTNTIFNSLWSQEVAASP